MLLQKFDLDPALLEGNGKILVALSGGRDSVALFHALLHHYESQALEGGKAPRFSLAVAHLNHQNRGEDSWIDANFVETMMEAYKNPFPLTRGPNSAHTKEIAQGQADLSSLRLPPIPLYLRHQDVPAEARAQKRGFEVVAREIRYAYLEEIRVESGADWIAVAHNASDNAETFLFHLARGSGLRGLTGMNPVSGHILRPLLRVTRSEIDQFLGERNIPYQEDSTNASLTYARNRIRHQVLPALEIVNAQYLDHCYNTMSIIRQEDAFLDSLVQQQIPFSREEGGITANRQDILALPSALQPRGLQFLVEQGWEGLVLSQEQRRLALAVAESQNPSASLSLKHPLKLQRIYDTLKFYQEEAPQPLPEPASLPVPGEISWGDWELQAKEENFSLKPGEKWEPNTLWILPDEPLFLRSRQPGDRLKPTGRGSKSLKKWMIEAQIPAKQRDYIPVIITGSNQVLALPGLGVAEQVCPQFGQLAICLHYKKIPKHREKGGILC